LEARGEGDGLSVEDVAVLHDMSNELLFI